MAKLHENIFRVNVARKIKHVTPQFISLVLHADRTSYFDDRAIQIFLPLEYRLHSDFACDFARDLDHGVQVTGKVTSKIKCQGYKSSK